MNKCMIFDLDGTLLDSMWVWEKIDIDFLSKRGLEVTDEYIQEIKTHNFNSGSRYVIEKFGLRESQEEVIREWKDMAAYHYAHDVKLKAGVREFLVQAKETGFKLAVATSSTRELFEPCLKRNGVHQLFDSFTETTEADRGKAFPDVYELAASRCQAAVEDCIVYEDIYTAVNGAKSGGFYTVGVHDDMSAAEEDAIRQICDKYIYSFEGLSAGEFIMDVSRS